VNRDRSEHGPVAIEAVFESLLHRVTRDMMANGVVPDTASCSMTMSLLEPVSIMYTEKEVLGRVIFPPHRYTALATPQLHRGDP
jgi:hypothetical protein